MTDQKENQEPESCLEKLAETEKTAQEYLNSWKRERADFLNYKKEESKRMAEFTKFSNQVLVLEILEIADDLEIAQRHSRDPETVKQILIKVSKFLETQNVERIKVEGQNFDPALHEAIEAGDENSQKVEEIRAGYLMEGRVLRPARVKIVK